MNSWRETKRRKEEMGRREKPLIYQRDYWNGTRKCRTDVEIGKERQVDTKIQDKKLEERFLKKF